MTRVNFDGSVKEVGVWSILRLLRTDGRTLVASSDK